MESVAGLRLTDLYYRKPVSRHVYEFSIIIALILLFFAARSAWRSEGLADVGAVLVTAGLVVLVGKTLPQVLLRPWRGWMQIARLLSVVMTPVLLSILWATLVIPVAFVLRILRIRVMDTDFRSDAPSYWKKKEARTNDFKLLERQF